MNWQVSDQEFESVLSLPGAKRYTYFVKKVADWEEIWSLRNQDGWVLAGDPSGTEVVPVWPNQRYAQACVAAEWQDCEPAVIDLETWMKRWIPGMTKDGRQVAVFPTLEDRGIVVEPSRLHSDLSDECEEYD